MEDKQMPLRPLFAVHCCECDDRIGDTSCEITATIPTLCMPCIQREAFEREAAS
jgi:hypothetical protein